MRIGVFDSGIGGQAVARELQKAFPAAAISVVDDKAHLPYGMRPATDIIRLTDAAIQPLLAAKCDVIVLACNTATATAIETLRQYYPHTPFVGLEPMLKPAAKLTKTGIIAVCATPATLGSERYYSLKQHFAKDITVLEPNCSDWAFMIERKQVDEARIKEIVDDVCGQSADVIALACTHYHWIKHRIEHYTAGRATVIDPSEAIARQVTRLLKL